MSRDARSRSTVDFAPATARVRAAVFEGVRQCAQRVAEDTQASIRAGGIPSPNHVVSRPGEPPNADTHQLDLNVVVQEEQPEMRCRVLSRAPYAPDLEMGTVKMAARPSLRPALARHELLLVALVNIAVRRALSSGGT